MDGVQLGGGVSNEGGMRIFGDGGIQDEVMDGFVEIVVGSLVGAGVRILVGIGLGEGDGIADGL